MRTLCLASFVMASLAAAQPGLATEVTGDAKRSAAGDHFARGLHLFDNQDNDGALVEFRRAYELIPNPIVLFNIGLVCASMGDPVGSVDALGKVLESSALLKPEQTARARQVKAEQEQRIALLQIATNVPADIDIDGTPAGRTPLTAPVRVAAGTHLVTAVADGYLPARQATSPAAGAPTDLTLTLRPTEARLARLTVVSAIPGADVFVDGSFVGRTPLPSALTLAPGTRAIEVRRTGYRAQARALTIAEGEEARADFDLQPEPALAPAQYGRVTVLSPDASQLRWSIDGRDLGTYRGGVLLPPGPHQVRLERSGFEPVGRRVLVMAGSDHPIKVELRPTADTRQAYRSRVGTYRLWAFGTLAGGLAIAAGAGGYTYWSSGRLDDASASLAKVQADWEWGSGGVCDHSRSLSTSQQNWCAQNLSSAKDDVSRYRSLRTGGIIATSVGAALAVTGVVLLLASEDPKRYDEKQVEIATSPSWQPVVDLGPAGAGLGLVGRF